MTTHPANLLVLLSTDRDRAEQRRKQVVLRRHETASSSARPRRSSFDSVEPTPPPSPLQVPAPGIDALNVWEHTFVTAEAHAQVRFRRAIERRALWMLRTRHESSRTSRSKTRCSSSTSTPSRDLRSTRTLRCGGFYKAVPDRRLAEASALRGDQRALQSSFR